MTAPSLTLTEFLLARIAEDRPRAGEGRCFDGGTSAYTLRALAECEAKRRIVELYVQADHGCPDPCHQETVWQIMELLALPYAGHPDYRPEWRP